MTQIKQVEDRREIVPILRDYVTKNTLKNPVFHIRTEYVGVDVVINYEHRKPISIHRKNSSKISFLPQWVTSMFPNLPSTVPAQVRIHATLLIPRESPEESWFELTRRVNKILKEDVRDNRLIHRAYGLEVFNPSSLRFEFINLDNLLTLSQYGFTVSRVQYLHHSWLSKENDGFIEFFCIAEEDLSIPIKGYSIERFQVDPILGGEYPEILYYSTLRSVEDLQGSTGIFMPIGVIDPVTIGMSTITRIHLESYKRIDELDIHINDMIAIHISPLGLPLVHSVVTHKREIDGSNIVPIYPPENCPVCSELLYPHSVYHCCLNGYHGPQIK